MPKKIKDKDPMREYRNKAEQAGWVIGYIGMIRLGATRFAEQAGTTPDVLRNPKVVEEMRAALDDPRVQYFLTCASQVTANGRRAKIEKILDPLAEGEKAIKEAGRLFDQAGRGD